MGTSNTIILWKKHLTSSLPDPICYFAFIELEPHYPTQEVISLLRHTVGGAVVDSADIVPIQREKLWQFIKPCQLIDINKPKNFVQSISKNMLRELIADWKKNKPQDDPYIDNDISIIEAVLNS